MIDPTTKKKGPFTEEDAAAAGGAAPVAQPAAPAAPTPARPFFRWDNSLPNTPAKGSAMAKADAYDLSHPSNVLGIPTGNVPRQKPPAAPSPSSAVQVGTALRSTGHGLANAGTWLMNNLDTGTDKLQNAVTRPFRNADAWLANVGRAAMGQPADAVPAADVHSPMRPLPFGAASNAVAANAAPSAAARNPKDYDPAADNISQANLAALTGQRGAAPAGAPGINTGVTFADPRAPGGQRRLPVGAMVNGVPTFSDGTGPGGIPRTMTDDQIAHYGDNLSRADAGALAMVKGSDVMGGTPSTEQMVAQRMAEIQRPITGSRPTAEQFAAADRLAIAQRDPRSAAGIAARNLAVEAGSAGTPRLRRMAEAALMNLQQGTQQSALQEQAAESARALADQQAGNAMGLEQLRGANTLQNTALARRMDLLNRAKEKVTLEDGTLGLIDPTTGAVTTSRKADGTPAKSLVTKDDSVTKRTNEVLDMISKGAQEQLKTFLPSKDKAAPGPEDILQARELAARAQGLHVVANEKTGERQVYINNQWMPL